MLEEKHTSRSEPTPSPGSVRIDLNLLRDTVLTLIQVAKRRVDAGQPVGSSLYLAQRLVAAEEADASGTAETEARMAS